MRNIIPMELTDLNSSISMKLRPTYGGLSGRGVVPYSDIATFETNIAYPLRKLLAKITAQQDLHGYSHPWAGGAGKNVIPTFSGTPTISGSGVTATVNADGSITLDGTATSTVTIDAPTSTWQWNGMDNYWLSGCPTGGDSANGYALRIDGLSNSYSNYDIGNGIKLSDYNNSISGQPLHFRIVIRSGTDVSGKTFKPMLNAGLSAQPYEPYSNICPINGYDEVVVTRTGENLFASPNVIESGTLNDDGLNAVYWQRLRISDYIPVKAGDVIKVMWDSNIVTRFALSGYTANDFTTPRIQSISWLSNGSTVTIDSNVKYIRCNFNSADGYSTLSPADMSNLMILINGEYATYTTDLDGTRYGGTLDVTTGVLTIDKAMINGSDITFTYWVDDKFYSDAISGKTAIENKPPICEGYVCINSMANDFQKQRFYIEDTSANHDASVVNSRVNGLKFVYYLATPQIVQLTSQEVESICGQNNIWANSGQVYVEYHFVEDFEE